VSPQTPLRVALIGYGLGGSVFHAPLISVSPRLSLAAVVTSDPDRQARARQRLPHVRIVPSVNELLDRAGEFDLAVVTVPNAAHVSVAEQLLRAGQSVVVDKPVAPTAAEVEGLGGLAAQLGRRVIPYHNRRWDGDLPWPHRWNPADSDRSGGSSRGPNGGRRRPPRAASWKQDPSQPGGGVLYDLGSHLIDQVLVLFGRPTSVYAELAHRTGLLDDDAFVALTSSCTYGPVPRPPPDGVETITTLPGAYQQFYAGLAACLLDGAEPPVPLQDAVVGLRVNEAAKMSADSGRVVTIS
jgi:predicted dehydrogenase